MCNKVSVKSDFRLKTVFYLNFRFSNAFVIFEHFPKLKKQKFERKTIFCSKIDLVGIEVLAGVRNRLTERFTKCLQRELAKFYKTKLSPKTQLTSSLGETAGRGSLQNRTFLNLKTIQISRCSFRQSNLQESSSKMIRNPDSGSKQLKVLS